MIGTEIQLQRVMAFFDPSPDRSNPHLPERPSEDEIRERLSDCNEDSPLNEIIVSDENAGNMRTIRRLLFTSMKRYHHSMRGNNIGFYAGSGQGKSFIVRQIVKTIGLPLVDAQAAAIDDTYALFNMMQESAAKHNNSIAMIPQSPNGQRFTCPPMVVFIDEAHGLKPKLMKGGLLNAMEMDDGIMVCSSAPKSDPIIVDCKNVCWIIATTERGMLFDAFDNRLQTHINWHPAGEEEIAQIVVQKMDRYADRGEVVFSVPYEAAVAIAKYRRIPREAIGFARKVIQEKDMFEVDWLTAVDNVAKSIGINEFGMSKKEVLVLKALGQRSIAKGNLITVAKCRIEELEKYVLPPLMDYSNGGPYCVSTSRGVQITRAGIERLNEMGISNKGDKATVEHAEERK